MAKEPAKLRLIPRQVTIQSEAKFFRLGEPGSTDGSILGMTFDIPEGLDTIQIRRLMFEEKRTLDLAVLQAERLKGTVPPEVYVKRVEFLKASYAKALKEEQ